MTFADILLVADIPCRPIENPMTLLTMFFPAFLCHFSSYVQVSVLTHKLVKATYSCHCICYFFPPQGLFFSKAEMDVFLPSATLKALFWGMCPIWTQQRMCVTLIVGPVSSFWLQESFLQVNSWKISLWTLEPLAQTGGVHHSRSTLKCAGWTVLPLVWLIHTFLFSSGVNLAPPGGSMFQNTQRKEKFLKSPLMQSIL